MVFIQAICLFYYLSNLKFMFLSVLIFYMSLQLLCAIIRLCGKEGLVALISPVC